VAVLETATGARGTVELSRTRTLRNTCVLECELASVEVELFEPYAQVVLRLTDGAPQLAGPVGGVDFAARPYLTLFEHQLRDFVEAIRLGRPPFVSGSEGRRSIALIEACYAIRRPLEQPWDYPRVYDAVR
jgi:predicted dehydrogenase